MPLTEILAHENASDYDWETLYAGYRFDIATGLYQVRYRYLNSTVGNWLARDPIGYLAGMNSNAYIVANPVSRVDPTGLQPADGDACNQQPNPMARLQLVSEPALPEVPRRGDGEVA